MTAALTPVFAPFGARILIPISVLPEREEDIFSVLLSLDWLPSRILMFAPAATVPPTPVPSEMATAVPRSSEFHVLRSLIDFSICSVIRVSSSHHLETETSEVYGELFSSISISHSSRSLVLSTTTGGGVTGGVTGGGTFPPVT